MNINARAEPIKKPILSVHGRSGKNRFKIILKKTQVSANIILAARRITQMTNSSHRIFLTSIFINAIISNQVLKTRK